MKFNDSDIKEFSNPLEDNFDINEDFYGGSSNDDPLEENSTKNGYINYYYKNYTKGTEAPLEEETTRDDYVNYYYQNYRKEKEIPIEEDSVYDIYKENNINSQNDKSYSPITQLVDLIGFLEDEEVDNIEELYGITKDEYMNPTKETLEKVKNHLVNRNKKHL